MRPPAVSTTTTASCSTRSCAQSAFVTGALIQPQRTGIVHHVILYEAAGAQAAAATQLNASHGGKGWSCFGGPGPAGRPECSRRHRPARPAAVDRRVGPRPHVERAAGGHGRAAAQGREDRDAGPLQPDRRHRRPTARRRSCGCGPRRRKLTPLETHLVAAPVELPCPAGTTGPQCSRDAGVRRTRSTKYGVQNAFIPTALLASAARRSPTTRRTSAPARDHDIVRPRVRRRSRRSTASRATCTSAAGTSRSCSTPGRRRSRRCCTSRRGTSTGRTSTT